MTTTDVIVWLSAGLLVFAVAVTGAFAAIELRRPPIVGRLEEIVRAATGKKKGPCP